MARIGFKKAKYNVIDKSTHKYKTISSGGSVPMLTKVIDEKFNAEYNSAELYASDSLAESDYSFNKGTLTITVADDDDAIDAILLGNTVKETSGETICNIADMAVECGYGHIVTKMVNGERKYKVEFFPRVKFVKVTTDAKTRGAGLEFGTTEMEATVFPLDEITNGVAIGVWEIHKTFDTEALAETFLDTCLTPSA